MTVSEILKTMPKSVLCAIRDYPALTISGLNPEFEAYTPSDYRAGVGCGEAGYMYLGSRMVSLDIRIVRIVSHGELKDMVADFAKPVTTRPGYYVTITAFQWFPDRFEIETRDFEALAAAAIAADALRSAGAVEKGPFDLSVGHLSNLVAEELQRRAAAS